MLSEIGWEKLFLVCDGVMFDFKVWGSECY